MALGSQWVSITLAQPSLRSPAHFVLHCTLFLLFTRPCGLILPFSPPLDSFSLLPEATQSNSQTSSLRAVMFLFLLQNSLSSPLTRYSKIKSLPLHKCESPQMFLHLWKTIIKPPSFSPSFILLFTLKRKKKTKKTKQLRFQYLQLCALDGNIWVNV